MGQFQEGSYSDINSERSGEAWNTLTDVANPNGQWASQAGMNIGDYARNQFFSPGGVGDQVYGMTMNPTSQFYQGQQALAQRGAQQGIDLAANQMAGMGGLYSGAMQDAGNRAAQDAMLQATNNTNQLSSNMLNNLWSQGMGQSYGAGSTMANIGAGIYGQGLAGVESQGNPLFEYNPGTWDRLMQGAQVATSFFPGYTAPQFNMQQAPTGP